MGGNIALACSPAPCCTGSPGMLHGPHPEFPRIHICRDLPGGRAARTRQGATDVRKTHPPDLTSQQSWRSPSTATSLCSTSWLCFSCSPSFAIGPSMASWHGMRMRHAWMPAPLALGTGDCSPLRRAVQHRPRPAPCTCGQQTQPPVTRSSADTAAYHQRGPAFLHCYDCCTAIILALLSFPHCCHSSCAIIRGVGCAKLSLPAVDR